jgi:hypothetical protein
MLGISSFGPKPFVHSYSYVQLVLRIMVAREDDMSNQQISEVTIDAEGKGNPGADKKHASNHL